MTAKALNLRPVGVGVIPPALNIGIVMKRLPPAAAEVAAPEVAPPPPPPTPALPAGSDVWYDAPLNSVIPFAPYAQAICADTPNNGFGIDTIGGGDNIEAKLFDEGVETLTASAWWQLTVPAGGGCLLMLDTLESRGGRMNGDGSGPASFPTDTNIIVIRQDPKQVAPFDVTNMTYFPDAVAVGTLTFNGLTWNGDDVTGNLSDTEFPYLSMWASFLPPNDTYWIRVDTWGGEAAMGTNYSDGLIYRLRVTLIPLPNPP